MARPAEMRPPTLASRHSSDRERFESPSLSSARCPYSQAESSGPTRFCGPRLEQPKMLDLREYSTGVTQGLSEIWEAWGMPHTHAR